MPTPAPIRILAPAKQTGDLFTRLVSDLFLALGYDAPRLNVHKTGREIDVEARHRTEPRFVLAECKATAKPIGGDDVNKFAGAVDAERRRNPGKDLAAYFVSLSGFTETALEQERDFGEPPRLVLLDGKRVAEELVHGRIVVSPGKALERAGRVANAHPDLTPDDPPQLLAHEIGWIWAVRFRRNAQVTHVALVHADGELLATGLGKQVLASDRAVKGDLYRLIYLPPPEPQPTQEARLEEARQAYFRYLAAECGELELEGLPADQEIGTRRLRLESLFVPLHLETITAEGEEKEVIGRKAGEVERLIAGAALKRRARLAILAPPGGGKTTLLKRLAVAYAFPERRSDLEDRLPDREWFPLFLRCRQLGTLAGEPITELLRQAGVWAELGELSDAFRSLIYSILREGRALLLVDGLDEIADPELRVAFASRLRTFLSIYPRVDVVVTSREAGFRAVAGALSAHCDHYRIADFNQNDVERMTVAWHREVVGYRKEVERQARALAKSIWETDRVRRLAVNPLLLTTLLLVSRWVSELPSRRTVLYEKAIEVLLMTWNLQGFKSLDLNEVKPQLAFLAWQMMEEGAQRISEPRLKEILREARRQMPEVLAYAQMGIDEFVERVERRSGVLALSGHTVEGGRLVQVYEFRHLTFQEHLAALALVEGNYPGRSHDDTLVSKLEPHLEEEGWKEVIPLAAALARRRAIPLVETLAKRIELLSENAKAGFEADAQSRVSLLAQCLLNEVEIPPPLVERAIEAIVRCYHANPFSYLLASGKYGATLREVTWRCLTSSGANQVALLDVWAQVSIAQEGLQRFSSPAPCRIREIWLRDDPTSRLTALALVTALSVKEPHSEFFEADDVNFLVQCAFESAQSEIYREQIAGIMALARLGQLGAVPTCQAALILEKLFEIWGKNEAPELRAAAAAALQVMPIVSARVRVPIAQEIGTLQDRGENEWRRKRSQAVALIARFYISRAGSQQDLLGRAKALLQVWEERIPRGLREVLEQLGPEGIALLREWERARYGTCV